MFSLPTLRTYFLYFTLFISGAVILVIEIAGARVLAPFYGSTIFVWSSLISVTLGFLALGYFIGGFIADKYPKGQLLYSILFLGGATGLLLIKSSVPLLSFSEQFGFRAGSLAATFLLFALPLFLLSMASPFAIRLLSRELEHTGHVSGSVFALSTVGSLGGALLVGFYLVPNFFISNIFTIAAAVMMGTTLVGLFLEKSPWRLILAAIVLFAAALLLPFSTGKDNDKVSVIHREPSFYGEIQVVEAHGLLCLVVESTTQTCIAEDGTQSLSYGNLITATFGEDFHADSALLIGLGGGVLARDLKERFDTIDVVEIDPKMVRIAKEFFNYDDSDPGLNTFVADGRKFIRASGKKYDIIIVDAFVGANPVPHLYTKKALEEIKDILSPMGMMIANTLGRPKGEGEMLPRSLAKTVGSVFPYLEVISTENVEEDPDAFGNILFLASNVPKTFPIRDEFIVRYNEEDLEGAILLTDARNPIELLGAAFAEETHKRYKRFLSSL